MPPLPGGVAIAAIMSESSNKAMMREKAAAPSIRAIDCFLTKDHERPSF